jgi:non-specific serine/threonine protein kinase
MTEAPSGDEHALRFAQQSEDLLERFDAAWQERRIPQIEAFLEMARRDSGAADEVQRRSLLEELIKIDLEYRWRRRKSKGSHKHGTTVRDGESARPEPGRLPRRPHLEDYLRRFPLLGSLEQLSLELVVEEYRVRHRWGDRPSHDVYQARFPQLGEALLERLRQIDADLPKSPAEETTVSRSDVRLADEPPRAMPTAQVKVPRQIGRYAIRKVLGRGAFGIVYLGHDPELERQVAIKVPRTERIRRPKDIQAIFREARLAAQLRHPALVEVYDVGREENGRCYIVMEFIEGHSLQEIIRAGKIPWQRAARWIMRIAEAVHCAHKVGLIHADLKPGNILIDAEDEPHVADFGLTISEADQRRRVRQVAGTPAYMAPEQVRGESHRLDGRADLWSLGAMLYEMLTARLPFQGNNIEELFDEIQHRDPKPLRQIDDSLTPDLEWICLKCLAKEAGQRYTTALDLARDLYEALVSSSRHLAGAGQPRWGGGTNEANVTGSGSRGGLPSTNLVAAPTSFIGRQRELAELEALVCQPTSWLVTLLGPGGIGKTRLSQRLAGALVDKFPGGCWFAELERAHSAAEIAHAVAHAFGVPLTSSEPPEQTVANVLEYRRPLLLVLDNFEQAAEHAQATVGFWRQRAPHVKFLATSRSLLNLAGERQYELGPLALPADHSRRGTMATADLAQCDSVKLFCDRASQVQPGFELNEQNAAAVAEICRGLDGIPLAVELAAARIKVLEPAQVASKLVQKFQLLQSSRKDLTPRQQTLMGAIDWSYGLLNEWEKQAFMQASVFRGGFFLGAAEQVIDLTAFAEAPLTMDVVQSLREKSLLTRQENRYEARFGMYQSIREYAEQKWRQSSTPAQQQTLAERFARHFINDAEAWTNRLHGPEIVAALDRLQIELSNLFAVEDWGLETGHADMAARAILAAAPAMAVRGPTDHRVPRLERALAALPVEAVELRVDLLTALSDACQCVGAWDRAVALADEAVELSRSLGRGRLQAAALLQQGEMRRHRGDLDGAHTCFVQAESISRQLQDTIGMQRSLAGRGIVAWQRGDSDLALRCYDEADGIAAEVQDHLGAASIARHRGHVLWQRGDYNGALRCYAEAEAIARQLGDQRTIHLTIGNRGIVLADRGDYDGALQCYAEAETIARQLGDKRGIAMNVGNRGISLSDRGDPQAALACYTEAEAINRQIQTKFGIAVNIGNRGTALADLGDYDGALRCFAEAEALNREMGNKFLYSLNIGDRGSALVKLGRLTEANEALRAALAVLDEISTRNTPEYFTYQTLLAQSERLLGNQVAAAVLANEALRLGDLLGLNENHPRLRTREHLALLREIVAGAAALTADTGDSA